MWNKSESVFDKSALMEQFYQEPISLSMLFEPFGDDPTSQVISKQAALECRRQMIWE